MKSLHVAVGVIEQGGDVLVAKRPDKAHMSGYWEFPGGKVEPGEAVQDALSRELDEELGIKVLSSSFLMKTAFTYHDRHVTLDVWRVRRFEGLPSPREGQSIQWQAVSTLQQLRFLPANQPIINACQLPDSYGISNDMLSDVDTYAQDIKRRIIRHRLSMFQLRSKNLSFKQTIQCSEALLKVTRPLGCKLIVNADPAVLDYVDVEGVHLSQQRAREVPDCFKLGQRDKLIGVSCHNEQEVERALCLNPSYITLSPVHSTASHRDVAPLGWQHFARLASKAQCPVYALGGMLLTDIDHAKQRGAVGIAGISAFQATLKCPS